MQKTLKNDGKNKANLIKYSHKKISPPRRRGISRPFSRRVPISRWNSKVLALLPSMNDGATPLLRIEDNCKKAEAKQKWLPGQKPLTLPKRSDMIASLSRNYPFLTCRQRPVSYTHLDVYKRQFAAWWSALDAARNASWKMNFAPNVAANSNKKKKKSRRMPAFLCTKLHIFL